MLRNQRSDRFLLSGMLAAGLFLSGTGSVHACPSPDITADGFHQVYQAVRGTAHENRTWRRTAARMQGMASNQFAPGWSLKETINKRPWILSLLLSLVGVPLWLPGL